MFPGIRQWVKGRASHLGHHVAQLILHLLLSALEALPQVVAHAAALQQRAACLLGRLDLDEAVDVLDGAAQEGGAQDALGDLGRLLAAVLVQECEVDVSLEMRAEPGREVGALCC